MEYKYRSSDGKTYTVPEEYDERFRAAKPDVLRVYNIEGKTYSVPLDKTDAFDRHFNLGKYAAPAAPKAEDLNPTDIQTAGQQQVDVPQAPKALSDMEDDELERERKAAKKEYDSSSRKAFVIGGPGMPTASRERLSEAEKANPARARHEEIEREQRRRKDAAAIADIETEDAEMASLDSNELARRAEQLHEESVRSSKETTSAIRYNSMGLPMYSTEAKPFDRQDELDRAEKEITRRSRNALASTEMKSAVESMQGIRERLDTTDSGNTVAASTRQLLTMSEKLLDAPSTINGGKGYWQGVGDGLTNPDTYTMGVSGIARNAELCKVAEKIGNGEEVTQEEMDLIDAYADYLSVQMARQNDLPAAYLGGVSSAESMAFMAQMMLTGAAGAAIRKGLTKVAVRKFGKEGVERLTKYIGQQAVKSSAGKVHVYGAEKAAESLGKRFLYALPDEALGVTTQTLLSPTMWRDMEENKLEHTINNEDFTFRDFLYSYGNWLVENATERKIGAGIDAALGGVLGTSLNIWGRRLGANMGRYVQGPIAEMGGEYAGAGMNLLRSVWQTDEGYKRELQGEAKEMFTPKGFEQTAYAIVPQSALFGLVGSVNGAAKMRNYDKTRTALMDLFKKQGATDEQAERIMTQVESSTTDGAFMDRLNDLMRASETNYLQQNGSADIEQAKAAMAEINRTFTDYFQAAYAYNQVVDDVNKRFEALPDEQKTQIADEYKEYVGNLVWQKETQKAYAAATGQTEEKVSEKIKAGDAQTRHGLDDWQAIANSERQAADETTADPRAYDYAVREAEAIFDKEYLDAASKDRTGYLSGITAKVDKARQEAEAAMDEATRQAALEKVENLQNAHDLLLNYFAGKAGMAVYDKALNDRVEAEIMEEDVYVQERIGKDGQYTTALMADKTAEPVDGQTAMTDVAVLEDDGTTAVIKYHDGHTEQVSSAELSGQSGIDPVEYMRAIETNIRQTAEEERQRRINAATDRERKVAVTALKAGDEVRLDIGGQKATGKIRAVTPDGYQIAFDSPITKPDGTTRKVDNITAEELAAGLDNNFLNEAHNAFIQSVLDEKEQRRQGESAARAAEEAVKAAARRENITAIDDFAGSIGQTHNVTHIHNAQEAAANGISAKAYKDANAVFSNGRIYVFDEKMTGTRQDALGTITHELVAHQGLRIVLGKDFDSTLDKVWNGLSGKELEDALNYALRSMSVSGKLEGINWDTATDEQKAALRDKYSTDQKVQRLTADEYIATLAEKTDLTEEEKTIWDNIIEAVKKALDKILGAKDALTRQDVEDLIRLSYANMRNQARRGETSAAPAAESVEDTEREGEGAAAPTTASAAEELSGFMAEEFEDMRSRVNKARMDDELDAAEAELDKAETLADEALKETPANAEARYLKTQMEEARRRVAEMRTPEGRLKAIRDEEGETADDSIRNTDKALSEAIKADTKALKAAQAKAEEWKAKYAGLTRRTGDEEIDAATDKTRAEIDDKVKEYTDQATALEEKIRAREGRRKPFADMVAVMDKELAEGTLSKEEEKELMGQEPVNLEDYILSALIGDRKFVWGDSANGTKGLGSHLFGTKSESERRKRFGFIASREKGGLYPEKFAEKIWETLPEQMAEGVTDRDIFNEMLDYLRGMTKKQMRERILQLRQEAKEGIGADERHYLEGQREQYEAEEHERLVDTEMDYKWAKERALTEEEYTEYLNTFEGPDEIEPEGQKPIDNGQQETELQQPVSGDDTGGEGVSSEGEGIQAIQGTTQGGDNMVQGQQDDTVGGSEGSQDGQGESRPPVRDDNSPVPASSVGGEAEGEAAGENSAAGPFGPGGVKAWLAERNRKAEENYRRSSNARAEGSAAGVSTHDFVEKDPKKKKEHPLLGGVYHKDGKEIATDGYALLIKNAEYAPELEGKVTDKKGRIITQEKEGKELSYPNYVLAFPRQDKQGSVSPSELHAAIQNAEAVIKNGNAGDGVTVVVDSSNGKKVPLSYKTAKKLDELFSKVGKAPIIEYYGEDKSLVFIGGDYMGLAMPLHIVHESTKKALAEGRKEDDYAYANKDFAYDADGKKFNAVGEAVRGEDAEQKPQTEEPSAEAKPEAATEVEEKPESATPLTSYLEPRKEVKGKKLEDFGEKIGGARKDVVRKYADKINPSADTFGKMFPAPDIRELLEAGLSLDKAAAVKALYDMAKHSFAVHKKNRGKDFALGGARSYALHAKDALLNDIDYDKSFNGYVFTDYGKELARVNIAAYQRLFAEFGIDYAAVDLSDYSIHPVNDAEREALGRNNDINKRYHPEREYKDSQKIAFTVSPNLRPENQFETSDEAIEAFVNNVRKGVDLSKVNAYEIGIYNPRDARGRIDYHKAQVCAKIRGFGAVELIEFGSVNKANEWLSEHEEDAQQMAAARHEQLKSDKTSRPLPRYRIEYTHQNGKYVVVARFSNKDVPLKEFPYKGEFNGRDYVRVFRDDVFPYLNSQEAKESADEAARKILNEKNAPKPGQAKTEQQSRERKGKNWREGQDVTPEMMVDIEGKLKSVFGFRAVEFGNYVTAKERQEFLNDIYDALMDLSEIIGVSPRALSLNGKLALAIGARGIGGASGHYEPAKNVINVTKTSGRGVLAHEWLHALDYYFSSYKPDGIYFGGAPTATKGRFKDDVREEIEDAYKNLMQVIAETDYHDRAEALGDYWSSPTELASRAFQDYVIRKMDEKGLKNDFLSNHIPPEQWNGSQETYPFPLDEEVTAIGEAFDKLFEVIQEKEENGQTVLYQLSRTPLTKYLGETHREKTEDGRYQLTPNYLHKDQVRNLPRAIRDNNGKIQPFEYYNVMGIIKANPLYDLLNKYSQMYVPYRRIVKDINLDNYFIGTDATFKTVMAEEDYRKDGNGVWVNNRAELNKKWQEMKDSGKYTWHQSPLSDSEYLIDEESGDIYRFADHWGKLSSCTWKLDETKSLDGRDRDNTRAIAKANIKDFTLNGNEGREQVTNPEVAEKYGKTLDQAIVNYRSLRDGNEYSFAPKAMAKLEQSLADLEALKADYDNGGIEAVADRGVRYQLSKETDAEMDAREAAEAESLQEEDSTRFQLRTKPAPTKTIDVYKLMRLHEGKLYPLYIDSKSSPLALHNWYDGNAPKAEHLKELEPGYAYLLDWEGNVLDRKVTKTKSTGLPSAAVVRNTPEGQRWVSVAINAKGKKAFYNIGLKGSNGVGIFAMRPGWHAGKLPSMHQIGKGKDRNLRDDSFVWVRGKLSAEHEFGKGDDGWNNSTHDMPLRMPVDGFYSKPTNPLNSNEKAAIRMAHEKGEEYPGNDWYISGSFMPEEIISDKEARRVIDEYNASNGTAVPYDYPRESGRFFDAETMSLVDNDDDIRYQLSKETDAEYMAAVEAGDMEKAAQMVRDAAKAKGFEYESYHGTDNGGFYAIDMSESDDKRSFFSAADYGVAMTYTDNPHNEISGTYVRSVKEAEELFRDELDRNVEEVYVILSKDGGVSAEHYNYEFDTAEEELEDGETVALAYKITDEWGETDYSFGDADGYLYGEQGLIAAARNATFMKKSGVAALFVKFNNPYVIDARGENWDDIHDGGDKLSFYISPEDEDDGSVQLHIEKYHRDDNVRRGWDDIVDFVEFESKDAALEYIREHYNEKVAEIVSQRHAESAYYGLMHMEDVKLFFDEDSKEIVIGTNTRGVAADAFYMGCDGAIIRNVTDEGKNGRGYSSPSTVFISFKPNQIKSADPVTYDDNGNVIPLSERFNSGTNDIRYQLSTPSNVASQYYEEMTKGKAFAAMEAHQDAMRSLLMLQRGIAKEMGRSIEDFEDAYIAENEMSSANYAQGEHFLNAYYNPIVDTIKDIMKTYGYSRQQVYDYMMAKHGIERNRVMGEKAIRSVFEKAFPSVVMESEYADLLEEAIRKLKRQGFLDKDMDVTAFMGTLGLDLPGKTTREIDALNNDRENAIADFAEWVTSLGEHRDVDFSGLTQLTGEKEDFTAAAQHIIDSFENKVSKEDVEKLWQRTNAATKKTLRTLREGGLMSEDTYALVRDMYEYYIPLRGWGDTVGHDVWDYVQADAGRFGSVMKTAKGRTSKADDPVATIAWMGQRGIMQANRNLMKQRLLNLAQNAQSSLLTVSQTWIVRSIDPLGKEIWTVAVAPVPADAKPEQAQIIIDGFERDMRLRQSMGDAKQVNGRLNVPYRLLDKEAEQHAVIVKEAGRSYTIYVNGNPRAAQAINGLLTDTGEGFWQKVDEINRFMASNFTQRNPAFILSNLSRDVIFSRFNVAVKEDKVYSRRFKTNQLFLLKAMLGLVQRHKKGKLDLSDPLDSMYNDFVMNGGETGYTNLLDIEQFKAKLDRLEKGKTISLMEAWEWINTPVEILNKASENLSRFAAFMTSRQMGRSISRSAWDAKQVSVDFNKKGTGKGWRAGAGRHLLLFYNAAVQSLYQFGKLAKEHKGRFYPRIFALVAGGALMPLLCRLLAEWGYGGDPDDYDNLPDSVRRNNICIPLPGGKFLLAPLPIELRAFYGMGELMTQWMRGEMKYDNVGLAMVAQMSELLPLDIAAYFNSRTGNLGLDLGATVGPDVLRPFFQKWRNADYFGLPIYRKNAFNENMPAYTKAYKGTNRAYVSLSEALNDLMGGDKYTDKTGGFNNPALWEFTLNAYFGGTYKTAMQFTHLVGGGIRAIKDEDPDLAWRTAPILNRFVADTKDSRVYGRKINKEFYRYKDELEKFSTRLNGYKNEVKFGNALEYQEKMVDAIRDPDYKAYQMMLFFEKRLKVIEQQHKLGIYDDRKASDKALEVREEAVEWFENHYSKEE